MARGGLRLVLIVTLLCQPAVWVSLEATATTLDHRECQKHTKRRTYTVAQRTCPVFCPQYQMAVVSRSKATMLDPGQVISLQNISRQRGHSAASESLAASSHHYGFKGFLVPYTMKQDYIFSQTTGIYSSLKTYIVN